MGLDKQQILAWALEEATYEELEQVCKALYSIYAAERDKRGIKKPVKPKRLNNRKHKKTKKLDVYKQKQFVKPKTIERS